MALTDNLVGYYSFEENFDEEFYAQNSVPPFLCPLQPQIDFMRVKSVAGKIAKAARFTFEDGSAMYHTSHPVFTASGINKTIAFRFKKNRWLAPNTVPFIISDYTITVDDTTQQLRVEGQAGTGLTHTKVLEADVWYFVVVTMQTTGAQTANLAIRFDNEIPQAGAILLGAADVSIAGGDFDIDELGFWDRILTAGEMEQVYNDSTGMSYAEIVAESEPRKCRAIDCCENPLGEYVSATGEGKGFSSDCEPFPKVIFEPPSGSQLNMPSLILLSSDNPNAIIHYTTDNSEPDANALVYSEAEPIIINSPVTVIRAVAIVPGCPQGPESNAQYSQWSPAAHFTYACTTTDKAGQWGAFAADGNPDYNWELQIQFTAITAVRDFTILQLNTDGTFTGAVWSTKEYPLADHPLNRAFPLVIFTGGYGGAQQNAAYTDNYSASFGNFAAAAHTLSMAGQPMFSGGSLPSDWLFQLIITFSDGTTMERVVDNTCDALPPSLCPVPTINSMGYSCGPPKSIDLFYFLAVGTPRKIFRSTSPTGPFTEIASGNVAATPETYQDQTIVPNQDYYYYIANIPAGCSVYVSSIVYWVSALRLPTVSISTSSASIGIGQSVTISWSSVYISGNVTISPTIGVQPGNLAGSQVVAPVVTTTYTISGANFCGDTATAQVTVEVLSAPSCGATQPSIVQINGYIDSFFNLSGCGSLENNVRPVWPGHMVLTGSCYWGFLTGFSVQGKTLSGVRTSVKIVGGLWQLDVWMRDATGNDLLAWRGTKAYGSDPLGLYTRTAGCSGTPASLTLTEIPTATCGATQPGNVKINGYADNLFVGAFGGCANLAVSAAPAWDGIMLYRPWVGPCEFLTDYSVSTFIVDGGGRRVLAFARVRIISGTWVLRVVGYQAPAGDTIVWEGVKASGDTPVGIYNRTSGCDSTIPQVTLIAV